MRRWKPQIASIAATAAVLLLLAVVARLDARGASAARPPGAQTSLPAGAAKPPAVANPHGDIRIACEACHTAESWTSMRSPSTFDHSTTGFPLLGRHQQAACRDCHSSKIFSRVATSCADCHRDVHQGRNGLRCQDCHVPVRWVDRPDAIRKHASTSFPLQGVHALLECTRCHVGQDETHVTRVASDCVSCHAEDYASTRNPDHTTAGFSQQCETCHNAARATWSGAGFDHARTGFALNGAHRSLQCTGCHTGGSYAGLSADCYACHRADYDGTTNPNHATAGLPTTCTTCHTTTAWQPASFDHSRTRFPLTGAHVRAACAACHANGQYTGTPTDCLACHQADYDGTADPNHAAAGFPTSCTSCHTTTAWQPANWNHDTLYFRIYSGAHREKWSSCTECHTNPSNYQQFSCMGCHSQSQTDPEHREVSGYRYESTACYTCHRGV